MKPLFPAAWTYYSAIVTSIAALLVVFNAWLGVVEGQAQAWVSAGISVLAAVLVWLQKRAKTLGVAPVPTDSPEVPIDSPEVPTDSPKET